MCYLKITEAHLKTISKYNNKSKNLIYTQNVLQCGVSTIQLLNATIFGGTHHKDTQQGA